MYKEQMERRVETVRAGEEGGSNLYCVALVILIKEKKNAI